MASRSSLHNDGDPAFSTTPAVDAPASDEDRDSWLILGPLRVAGGMVERRALRVFHTATDTASRNRHRPAHLPPRSNAHSSGACMDTAVMPRDPRSASALALVALAAVLCFAATAFSVHGLRPELAWVDAQMSVYLVGP